MKYEKYINCNFGWNGLSLIYRGMRKSSNTGEQCSRCKKEIKNIEYIFTEENNEQLEYSFGLECVKEVFGAGLEETIKEDK